MGKLNHRRQRKQSITDNSDEQVTDIAIGSNMLNEATNNVSEAINVIDREAIHATIGDSNTHNSVESESFNENNIELLKLQGGHP